MCCELRFFHRLIIVFLIYLVAFLLPFGLVYGLGYVKQNDWDRHTVKTAGIIYYHNVRKTTCSEDTNCHQVCTGTNTCTTVCDTIYFECYYPSFYFYYIVNNVTYPGEYEANSYKIKEDAEAFLHSYYPIGNQIVCYYDSRKHADVHLHLYNVHSYYVGSVVWVCIGSFAVLIWILYELGVVIRWEYRGAELEERFLESGDIDAAFLRSNFLDLFQT